MWHSKWQGNWKRSHVQFISRKKNRCTTSIKRGTHTGGCANTVRESALKDDWERFSFTAFGSWTCVCIVLNRTLNQLNYIPTSVLLCLRGGVAVTVAPYRILRTAVLFLQFMNGERDSSVVKCQTCDQKVLGLSPGRSGGRIFYSFCQKCTLQVTAKHIRTLPMWLQIEL